MPCLGPSLGAHLDSRVGFLPRHMGSVPQAFPVSQGSHFQVLLHGPKFPPEAGFCSGGHVITDRLGVPGTPHQASFYKILPFFLLVCFGTLGGGLELW